MEIVFDKKTVSCCRECFRQTKIIQEHAECIVSDVFEDIGKIAFTDTQLFLRGKELTAHGASVSGCAEITVFYITEGQDGTRCMSLSKDFTVDFDSEAVTADSTLFVSLSSQGVQARAVNSRKIAVQFSVCVELSAWNEDLLPVRIESEEDPESGLQLLYNERNCVATSEIAEKSFVISEQLPLGKDTDLPVRIVCSHAELFYSDHQMIGSKVLLKGGAVIRFGYEEEGGKIPVFCEQSIPFSVLIDSPGEEVEIARLVLEPTALYVSLGDAINGTQVAEIELHAVAQLRFSVPQRIAYIADAYSTRYPLACREECFPICIGSSSESIVVSTREEGTWEGGVIEIAAKQAEILSFAQRDGKAAASAVISALLLTEDNTYTAVQKLLSFETPLPSPLSEIRDAHLISYDVVPEGGQLSFTAELRFDFAEDENMELHCVSAAELDTENAFSPDQLPALMVVRQKDRSLWDLSKHYHSSSEAIEEINKKYDLPSGLLLIPRA